MTNKRYLNDLTIDELEKVFENNQSIKDEVFKIVDEDNYYLLENEYVSHFRHYNKGANREHYTADVYFDTYGNASVEVDEDNYVEFLEDCKTLNEYDGSLWNVRELIDRLSKRANFFESALYNYTDISEKNWRRLLEWFSEGIETIADELKTQLQTIHDTVFDSDYLFEYFQNILILFLHKYYYIHF